MCIGMSWFRGSECSVRDVEFILKAMGSQPEEDFEEKIQERLTKI